jgi:hypothetical protein
MAVTGPFRVACVVLMTACGAVCQERPQKVAFSSLPDAPSVQAKQTEILPTLADQEESTAAAAERGVGREPEVSRPTQPMFIVLSNTRDAQENSSDFFDRYLCPTLLKRNLNYHPSASDSFVGRAMYAASRVFVTRDESGRARVNTSYFLGVLGAAALHTAYRPYWNRPASAPFSDFGSTIGNDAGMNLLHEFRPGLEQLMKSHAPRFVSKIEERIGRN